MISEPGSRVPAFLLVPKPALTSASKAPAVLALHQTRPEGQKVVVGLANSPNDPSCLALLSIASRMMDDGRDEAFNGYDSLVRVFDLEPPEVQP